jgi:hypothetical protein
VGNKLSVAAYYTSKLAIGGPYCSEHCGVDVLSGVRTDWATVAATKTAIGTFG